MLRCPTCGRPFEAGTQFCPDDGSRLLAEAPPPFAAAPYAPTPAAAPASMALPIIVGVLVVAVLGLAGVLLFQRPPDEGVAPVVQPVITEQPVEPTPLPPPVVPPTEYTQTVYANSPRDGYLVLRRGPRAARGTELLRIPHNAALELGACRSPTTTPAGRYGSWCHARYGSAEGWVFDAFISR